MNIKETKKIVHSERSEIEADINDLIIEELQGIQECGILPEKLSNNIVKLIVRLSRELSLSGNDCCDDDSLLLDSILCFSWILDELDMTTCLLKGEEYEVNKNFRDKK
ncbi:hypothetical protein MWN41_09875 [Ornithobacterium rhinotracheale]|uniref:hypothetical protein n=1 Tax=Ornithobacterium rhinotracheale TaxID=28251 RepID=UPI001FF2BFCD|nr:hypothetical protein [Ornithobacterium rhinotracheale]MCK0203318.1 hypothetical protein [Ornithobacterium rhinotracheale]